MGTLRMLPGHMKMGKYIQTIFCPFFTQMGVYTIMNHPLAIIFSLFVWKHWWYILCCEPQIFSMIINYSTGNYLHIKKRVTMIYIYGDIIQKLDNIFWWRLWRYVLSINWKNTHFVIIWQLVFVWNATICMSKTSSVWSMLLGITTWKFFALFKIFVPHFVAERHFVASL